MELSSLICHLLKQTVIMTVAGKQTLDQGIYLHLDRHYTTGLVEIFGYIPKVLIIYFISSPKALIPVVPIGTTKLNRLIEWTVGGSFCKLT